ncbi:unnamed protein product [Musa acuminata subsp. malaccensis]|uniref:poly(A)-specific ribonuclease n=1 Tax=Musa acuminata subsp. malaccensis TaxID=214687 RepID=A0A8D7FMV9_MUSAM|nr:unnamed protein product [Musa acuminata subsp. malaccensis]
MAINVGKANLVEQLELILSLRGSYPIVAIDTEFPGFIRDTPRNATEEERYNDVKHNVDNMHLIQLGVALFDEGGNTPWPGCCWQFNFSDFDPDVDASSPDSIELLVMGPQRAQLRSCAASLEEVRVGSGPRGVMRRKTRRPIRGRGGALRAEPERSGDSTKELREFLRLDRAEAAR